MKIQSVRVKNFRTLKDVTIPFDSVTTFIGPNGAGKSTVLRALDWYFNGKPGSLTEKDCSFGVTTENIEVQVTFTDLTDKDRDLFPAILALSQWSERWTPPPDGPVARILSRKSGRPVTVVMTDDPAVEALGMRDIEILPGPGARRLDPSSRRQ